MYDYLKQHCLCIIFLNFAIRKIEVPFPTERHADIVYQVLRVDAEPKRSEVKKSLELQNNILKV